MRSVQLANENWRGCFSPPQYFHVPRSAITLLLEQEKKPWQLDFFLLNRQTHGSDILTNLKVAPFLVKSPSPYMVIQADQVYMSDKTGISWVKISRLLYHINYYLIF